MCRSGLECPLGCWTELLSWAVELGCWASWLSWGAELSFWAELLSWVVELSCWAVLGIGLRVWWWRFEVSVLCLQLAIQFAIEFWMSGCTPQVSGPSLFVNPFAPALKFKPLDCELWALSFELWFSSSLKIIILAISNYWPNLANSKICWWVCQNLI